MCVWWWGSVNVELWSEPFPGFNFIRCRRWTSSHLLCCFYNELPNIAAQVWRVCLWKVNELFHLRGMCQTPAHNRDVMEKINILKRIYQLMLKEKEQRGSISIQQGQQSYFYNSLDWFYPEDINTPLNKTQRPHPHTSLKIISFLTWLNLRVGSCR